MGVAISVCVLCIHSVQVLDMVKQNIFHLNGKHSHPAIM